MVVMADTERTTHFALIALILGLIAFFVHYVKRKPKGSPPGSLGLPIFGHLLYMTKHPGNFLMEMRHKYGLIFSIFFGPLFTVVVNDYETAKEAFLKYGDVFSGRVHMYVVQRIYIEENQPGVIHGLISSEGKLWKEQRKLALKKLREFGMGKASIEDKIREEIAVLLTEFRATAASPFDIQFIMTTSVSNIICSIVFGERFEYDDEQFQYLLAILNENFQNSSLQGLFQFFPLLRFFPLVRGKVNRILQNANNVLNFMDKKIEECKESFDSNNIRNFIDAYLLELTSADEDSSTLSLRELRYIIIDLFLAGTETTSTTLRWGFLYLLKHPDVMKKVQAEIDDVVGRSRLPKMADKAKMPYTEATITEIQRCANILPMGVPHRSLEKATFKGYEIPANTVIISNMTAILNDPTYFQNPHAFNPDRFISPEGKLTGCEPVAAFCVGRRVCLGEALARMELFLFLTSILQNFDIELPVGVIEPNMEGTLGITFLPSNDPLVLRSR